MGEKFGILRLLRIYHSTSRVKGLGFDLLLNLGAGSENHCVQKKWTAVLHFSHRMGPRACPLAFYVQREGSGGSAGCLLPLPLRRVAGSGQLEGGG